MEWHHFVVFAPSQGENRCERKEISYDMKNSLSSRKSRRCSARHHTPSTAPGRKAGPISRVIRTDTRPAMTRGVLPDGMDTDQSPGFWQGSGWIARNGISSAIPMGGILIFPGLSPTRSPRSRPSGNGTIAFADPNPGSAFSFSHLLQKKSYVTGYVTRQDTDQAKESYRSTNQKKSISLSETSPSTFTVKLSPSSISST